MTLAKTQLFQVNHLTDDLQRKEVKWAAVVTKLQEQVKTLEKENQNLHNENHKLKLRGVSAKVWITLFSKMVSYFLF